jgi:hypothetical protein
MLRTKAINCKGGSMHNRYVILLLVLLLASSATGCTRSSSVEEIDIDKNAAEVVDSQAKPETTVVTPVENMPDGDT